MLKENVIGCRQENALLSNQTGNYRKSGFTQTLFHNSHIEEWMKSIRVLRHMSFRLHDCHLHTPVTHSGSPVCYDMLFISCSNINKHLYLQLLLLGEPFDSLPSRSLAHESHDPYQRSVEVQHSCNFLNTLAKRWKDHHTCAHLLCPTIWKCIRRAFLEYHSII